MANVKTRTIDMRTLVLKENPKAYSEPEPAYQFSNGRKFTKKQRRNKS